jgi:mono/diheme cytochrome c family protein
MISGLACASSPCSAQDNIAPGQSTGPLRTVARLTMRSEDAEMGKHAFDAACAACNGLTAAGLDGHFDVKSDGAYTIVRCAMDRFQSLTKALIVRATLLLWVSVLTFPPTIARADHALNNRNIAAGQLLYADHCASCHGADLEGQPNWQTPDENGVLPAPPHDRTGHTWHHDNELLFDYTRLGGQATLAQRGIVNFNSGMPAFDGVISDDEIWDIMAFIRSTWPKREQAVQAGRNPKHQ